MMNPGHLQFSDLRLLLDETTTLELDPHCFDAIHASEKVIVNAIQNDKAIYGINTGFGALAGMRIPTDQLGALQRSLVLSHAAGTGSLLSDDIVRLILALKINSLARGYSWYKRETLIQLFNTKFILVFPSQGSVESGITLRYILVWFYW